MATSDLNGKLLLFYVDAFKNQSTKREVAYPRKYLANVSSAVGRNCELK